MGQGSQREREVSGRVGGQVSVQLRPGLEDLGLRWLAERRKVFGSERLQGRSPRLPCHLAIYLRERSEISTPAHVWWSASFDLKPLSDPFIRPKMNWQPIIIALVFSSVVILFIIFPLLIFCCIKSVHRREEKSERKETLQRSLHASKQSLNSFSASRQSLDEINSKPLCWIKSS